MTGARRQVVLGSVTTLALCAIAYAGADHPPPPGFVLALVLIAMWTAVVSLARWRSRAQPRPQQWLAASAVGALTAVALWLGLWLAAAPSGDTSGVAAAIGFGVAAVGGAVGGTALTLVSWLFVDRDARSGTSPS